MRNGKACIVHHQIPVQENIQIESPRGIWKTPNSSAGFLFRFTEVQQFQRGKIGFDLDCNVQKPWLIQIPDRLRLEIRGYLLDNGSRRERLQGKFQVRFSIPDVRSRRDICFLKSHAMEPLAFGFSELKQAFRALQIPEIADPLQHERKTEL